MNEEQIEARKQRDEELAYVMDTEIGRRFIWRLLHQVCGIYSSNFSADAMLSAYAQGRRDVGLDIQEALLDCEKETFIKMEIENR